MSVFFKANSIDPAIRFFNVNISSLANRLSSLIIKG